MNIKNKVFIFFIIAITLGFIGCSTASDKSQARPVKISAQEAKEMIDDNKDIIILDVRSEAEYNSGHIKDAILIPHSQIKQKAEEIITDKSAVLLVYCRSSSRSAAAADSLSKLGYMYVYDFGGIAGWKYDIVKEE